MNTVDHLYGDFSQCETALRNIDQEWDSFQGKVRSFSDQFRDSPMWSSVQADRMNRLVVHVDSIKDEAQRLRSQVTSYINVVDERY